MVFDLGAMLSKDDDNMWFEVDFLKLTKIIGIKTQGRADYFEVVQTYTVSYSFDRNNFAHVQENNQIKVRNIFIFVNRYPFQGTWNPHHGLIIGERSGGDLGSTGGANG